MLMNGPVRDALNISENIKWGGQSDATFNSLKHEFMKPVTSIGDTIYTNSVQILYKVVFIL